jgi:membrane-bound ClpP family serine protease
MTSLVRTRGLAASLLLAAVGVVLLLNAQVGAQTRGGTAYSLELSGTIDPATERWLGRALDEA